MPTTYLGPFFSYPFNSTGKVENYLMDATVHQSLASLFHGLIIETKVRGALYIWRYEDFGQHQGDMHGPSVSSPKAFTDLVHSQLLRSGATDVKFIVDRKYMTDSTRAAFATMELPVTEDANSATGNGIMHSKFFTFSKLSFPADRAISGMPAHMDWVVAVLSANVDNAMYRAANNLLVMHGNEQLYGAFVALWDYIAGHPHASIADATTLRCDDVALFSFPRQSDTVLRVLEKILDQEPSSAKVRIAIYLFSRKPIRDALAKLAMHGADVKVVLSSFSHVGDETNRAFDTFLDEHNVGARLLPNNNGVMHSKYLLIDALYELQDTVSRRKLVWTGSHNYTNSALEENDEVIVRVDNQGVYDKYVADWERLWQLAGL